MNDVTNAQIIQFNKTENTYLTKVKKLNKQLITIIMKQKTIFKIAVAFTISCFCITTTFGQHTVTVPAASGTTLYEKGYNVANPNTSVETKDYVTVGTKVPYLVIPDPDLNPGWAAAAVSDATTTTGINSTWTWSIPGTISTTTPGTGHFIKIDVLGTATPHTSGDITVFENSGSACPGSTQTITLEVVAQPTASALSVSDGVDPIASICQSGTDGSLNVPFPTFTVTKSIDADIPVDAAVKVKATLVFTSLAGATTTYFTDAILNVNNSGVVSNSDITSAAAANSTPHTLTDFDSWGTYTLTITQISDKISRKDLNTAGGYFALNGGTGYSATYSVFKTPVTGPIYHLPNN